MAAPTDSQELNSYTAIAVARGDQAIFSDATDSDAIKRDDVENISRLQSAAKAYSASLTYAIGDFVVESGIVYRNTTAIATPEAFTVSKWAIVGEVFLWTADHSMGSFKLIAAAGNDVIVNAPTGQGLSVEVAGVQQYLLNAAQADFLGHNVVNAVLVTPTIASFVNATHDHTNAAGGGLLLSTTALSDTTDIAYLNQANAFGSFETSFLSGRFNLRDSDDTNNIEFVTNLETADRIITIPVLGANRSMVLTGLADQLTNTELTTGVFGKITGEGVQTQAFDMGTSNKIINLADPTGPQDAATRAFVLSQVTSLSFKESARVGTTGNITLSGNQAIDGITTVNGDRVLVKEQTLGQENGVYIADAGAWSRSTDTDTGADIEGMAIFIQEGTTLSDTGWMLTTDPPIIIDTTVLVYVQFTALGQVTAGNGLTKTGNTLDVGPTAGRISVSANAVDIDSAYVGQASITTLGTITTGIWNGTAIAIANIANGAANEVLKTNAGATALEFGLLANVNIAVGAEIEVSKLQDGTPGQFIRTDSAGTGVEWTDDIFTINYVIDGGGAAISTGIAGHVVVDFACEVLEWAVVADQTGSIAIDVNAATFANYPTMTNIDGSEPPTITSSTKGEDRSITTWSTLAAGDIIEFDVTSVTSIQRATIALKCRKTG